MKHMPPCEKECPDRAVGCHGRCEKYAAFRAMLDAEKPPIYARNDYESYVIGVRQRNSRHKTTNTRRYFRKDDKHG